jgi:CRISP-associated protein Cas1
MVQPSTNRRTCSVASLLILTGHGVRLRIDRGTLLVHDGFTHYPQAQKEFRFFPGDWRNPSRIVLVDGHGSLSLDVLDWLYTQEIQLVRINWRGEVVSICGGDGYACDQQIVRSQLAAQEGGTALELARFLIVAKIANSIETLRTALPNSFPIELAVQRLNRDRDLLREAHSPSIRETLGIEGRAAAEYFGAWRSLPLKWKGTSKHPIPEDWHRIGWRSSPANAKEAEKKNATHPLNAMLNYAYGMLENQVRAQVLAAGLDPRIGALHGTYQQKHALVFDLMEPLRPLVDAKLLKFVQLCTFSPGDFTITSEGICRLNPQLARNVVTLSLAKPELHGPIEDALGILGGLSTR